MTQPEMTGQLILDLFKIVVHCSKSLMVLCVVRFANLSCWVLDRWFVRKGCGASEICFSFLISSSINSSKSWHVLKPSTNIYHQRNVFSRSRRTYCIPWLIANFCSGYQSMAAILSATAWGARNCLDSVGINWFLCLMCTWVLLLKLLA